MYIVYLYFPFFLMIGVPPLVGAFNRKLGIRIGLVSAAIFLLFFLWVYVSGGILRFQANRGDARAMYEFARWTETHTGRVQLLVPLPISVDLLEGYAWLEKSAALNYPPAIYAIGVRLKYGEFVPCPEDWNGGAGNWFPQPERGQIWIDRALQLGYVPTIKEEHFYWKEYRAK